MTTNTATAFTRETVQLDGETFTSCEFKACRLVFSGGDAPVFEDCSFDDCDWRFEGGAAATLALMKTMWGAGAKARVQALIKDITGGGGR
jgi:hypothetical protein